MFDIGWPEMAVIMLVAIIIIGPKDLPRMARAIGKWTGKARAMARDFQRSLDDMAREAELEDIKKSIDKVGSPNKMRASMTSAIKDAIDNEGEIEDAMKVELPKSSAAKSPTLPQPPAKEQPAEAAGNDKNSA